MADPYVTPAPLPTAHERELLQIASEECTEVMRECLDVQQRISKLLRFGATEAQPGQLLDNSQRLGLEVGELEYMIDRLLAAGIINHKSVADGRSRKAAQLPRYMQTQPEAIRG